MILDASDLSVIQDQTRCVSHKLKSYPCDRVLPHDRLKRLASENNIPHKIV